MIDYVQQLREGIVEAYVGIVTALKSGGKGELEVQSLAHRDVT